MCAAAGAGGAGPARLCGRTGLLSPGAAVRRAAHRTCDLFPHRLSCAALYSGVAAQPRRGGARRGRSAPDPRIVAATRVGHTSSSWLAARLRGLCLLCICADRSRSELLIAVLSLCVPAQVAPTHIGGGGHGRGLFWRRCGETAPTPIHALAAPRPRVVGAERTYFYFYFSTKGPLPGASVPSLGGSRLGGASTAAHAPSALLPLQASRPSSPRAPSPSFRAAWWPSRRPRTS
jgi:hypothetical protein